MRHSTRILSTGAVAFGLMVPGCPDLRRVYVLAVPAPTGGCDLQVGKDPDNAKAKHFRRSADRDEPIVWQILNECGQDLDLTISDPDDTVTSYGGTNGFRVGTPLIPRPFLVPDGEGALGMTLISKTNKKKSICVAVRNNKCPDSDVDVQMSGPSSTRRQTPGAAEAPGGGETQDATVAKTAKRAQVQIDIFP